MTRILVAILIVITAGCGAAEQAGPAVSVTDLATYARADREQKLIEGARREGEITIYTSAQTSDLGPVVQAFEKKYGIKANLWRAGSEAVLNRVLQEARAGRHTVDAVATNGPELESMSRERRHASGNFYINVKPTGAVVGLLLSQGTRTANAKMIK